MDGVILSNGTLLTGEMVEVMQSLGLRLVLSLDGVGDYHDAQRSFADGRGSFDAVARAVDLAISGGLTLDISVTVSRKWPRFYRRHAAWIMSPAPVWPQPEPTLPAPYVYPR